MNASKPESTRDEPLDVRDMSALLLRQRWWILAAIALSTVGFTAAAYLIKPVYRASVVVIPVSSERNSLAGTLTQNLGSLGGGLASLAGLAVGSGDSVTQEALGVLRSKQFGEQFIQDQNLLPVLFASRWDSAAQTWKAGTRSPPTVNSAFKYFNKRIRTVTQDNKTGLITLQIDWRDRGAAAAWANELLRRVNAVMRSRAIANAEASIAFLEKELQTTNVVETRDAINRLIEAQVKQRMLATVTGEYAFRVVDPASAPDKDDMVEPPKGLLLVAGPIVGLLLSAACVLIIGPAGGGARARGIHPA